MYIFNILSFEEHCGQVSFCPACTISHSRSLFVFRHLLCGSHARVAIIHSYTQPSLLVYNGKVLLFVLCRAINIMSVWMSFASSPMVNGAFTRGQSFPIFCLRGFFIYSSYSESSHTGKDTGVYSLDPCFCDSVP